MDFFGKVNIIQLFLFWRNLAISLLTLITLMAFSQLLPNYMTPIVALVASGVLYAIMHKDGSSKSSSSCMLIVYATFISLLAYSMITILLNVACICKFIYLPQEFLISGNSYVCSLTLFPVCFLVCVGVYIRRRVLYVCIDCKIKKGDMYSRGKIGFILNRESQFQLRNMLMVFAILSVVVWLYYILFYVDLNINHRDMYIFIWLAILIAVIDEVYFIYRYYNLYMDLMDNDEILPLHEMEKSGTRNYLRFYVICGNDIYVDKDADSAYGSKVIDTPFFYKVPESTMDNIDQIRKLIEDNTGVEGGELRFFYQQSSQDNAESYILARYFYFLDNEESVSLSLKAKGEWMDYDVIKHIYSTSPLKLAPISITDTTRLATIILTEKIFDEKGNRRLKLKTYRPSFNLIDVRKSKLDFQDNKWIRVSMFNSDVRFFKLKRFWLKFVGCFSKTGKHTWN